MATKFNLTEAKYDGISINFVLTANADALTYSEWYAIVNNLGVAISQASQIKGISGVCLGVDSFRLEGAEYNQMGIEVKMIRE